MRPATAHVVAGDATIMKRPIRKVQSSWPPAAAGDLFFAPGDAARSILFAVVASLSFGVRTVGGRWLPRVGGVGLRLVELLMLASAAALLSSAQTVVADVYKYVDEDGNIYFSDEPLPGTHLSLEWKRTSKRLVAENKHRSDKLRREQDAMQARIEARLEAQLQARTDLYALRPAAPVGGSMSVRRARYRHLIEDAAQRHGLTPELLHAVIRTESAYQANARSHAGACGLMQLMPQTATRFSVADIWDPAENIDGGAAYLRFLLDLFDHDLRLALAGYNAGEGAVKKYGYQIPPYRETQDYVRKVLRHLTAERTPRPS